MAFVDPDDRAVLSLQQLGAPQQRWRVELARGSMRFSAPSGPEETLEGEELKRAINLTHSIAAKPLMAVKLAGGKLVLQLSEDDVRTLVAHVGPEVMYHAAVASHGTFNILLGALIIMSSLGPDDPLEPTGSSVKVLRMAVGALAAGIGLGSKLKPHRLLLALDTVWMAALVANVIHDVVFRGHGFFWALVVLVLAPAAYGRLRMYQLLAPPRPSADDTG